MLSVLFDMLSPPHLQLLLCHHLCRSRCVINSLTNNIQPPQDGVRLGQRLQGGQREEWCGVCLLGCVFVGVQGAGGGI